jgi:hypothetical protein
MAEPNGEWTDKNAPGVPIVDIGVSRRAESRKRIHMAGRGG